FDQQSSGFVIANDSDREYVHPEIGEVRNRVGASAGHDLAIAMLEDQDRRFAGDAGNFTENKFVGDKVSQHGDRDVGKRLDDLVKPPGFLGMFGHASKANSLTSSGAARQLCAARYPA